MGETVAVVLAGGRGSRVGAPTNKVLLELAGVPILVRSVRTFVEHPDVDRVVVVGHAEDLTAIATVLAAHLPASSLDVLAGGAERADSERSALEHLRADIDAGRVSVVLIHDGARPLVSARLIGAVVAATRRYGGAIPGLAVSGLLEAVDARLVPTAAATTVRVQTPQGFAAQALLGAYDAAVPDGIVGTDTAAYLERYGEVPVHVVPGEPDNLKVTWPEDLATAERHLSASP